MKAALSLLEEDGVDAVRVEAVARALGVTKGGFYGHFRDRAELLDAILAAWEHRGTEAIIMAADATDDPSTRVHRLWELATRDSFGPELAIRDWARRDESVKKVVERIDHRRMNYLRTLFGELGFRGIERESRCMLVYSLLIGDHFIVAGHPRTSRERVLRQCLAMLQAQK